MIFKYRLTIGFLFVCLFVVAQSSKMSKAEENFDEFAYADAIEDYEALINEYYTDVEVYRKLGDANYFNSDYETAAKWYRGLYMTANKKLDPEYLYRYAQSLKSLGRYDESNRILLQMKDTALRDIRLEKYLEKPDYLKEIENVSNRYEIYNVDFNSEVSDFAPAFYMDKIIFSSARKVKKRKTKIHGWNKMPFLNLYATKFDTINKKSSPIEYINDLSSLTHESSATFSKDGKSVFFTRNNFKDGNFVRDTLGVSRLKIFKAELVAGTWQNIQELPFNSDQYSIAHPSLNQDGTRLYFASDMPGTYGNSDIFYVDIYQDKTYGKPINLGIEVNTEGRETFPFISPSNILYFASDGHPGLGGLDIFAASSRAGEKTKVLNIGNPVNSVADDFAFIFNETNVRGYFASNRLGGQGGDDIYYFEETIPLDFSCKERVFKGIIKNPKGRAIPNVNVKLYDTDYQLIDKVRTNDSGEYIFSINCTLEVLMIEGEKEEFKKLSLEFSNDAITEMNNLDFVLDPEDTENTSGEDLGVLLGIEKIKFKKGKSTLPNTAGTILGKLVTHLSENPTLKVEIKQHTDSRGDNFINVMLSRRRAKSIKAYLIYKGISEKRLTVKGIGENQLINNCSDDVECSKIQHEENNRTEFITIK
ncbi:OmpA family protein [Maribacter sp. R77961]|uniref:OmpA family protein n=1 Tax=Maribacter sp. R77961 TaxID=3093871 RepID=UPI0037C538DD